MAAEVQLFLVAPARAAGDDAFRLAADTSPENSDWVKLNWQPFSWDKPWGVWFDLGSGDLVMLEHESHQMDGQLALARIKRSAPKGFSGLQYPSRASFESLRGGKVIESAEETIDAIELNPELPAGFFACPAWEFDAAAIGTKDMPAETVVKFEHHGPYTDVGKSLEPAMNVVMAAGLVPLEAVSCTYLTDPATVAPRDIRAELAIRVAPLKEGTPVLPSGYEFTTQPAARVAYAYHRGDHAGEGEAHERLRAWMKAHDLHPAGPPRAIWFHDPEVTVADDLATEVQIPIR
jgi:DNA gyrase inhibitor GyrI